MCLKKIALILSRSYKVDNLYVGLLGYVTKKEKDTISITTDDKDKRFIIYQKVEFEYGDYVAQDIFTKKKYFFWNGNKYELDTIFRAVDNYAIYKSLTIDQFLTIPKEYVSKTELLAIYNKLNNPQKEIEEEVNKTEQVQITDSILKTILETNDLVKKTLLDENLRNEIIQELEDLGKYYVDEILKLNDFNSGLILNNEYSIRMEVIKRLVEIENRIKNFNCDKKYSLIKQYNQFQSNLNNN